MNQITAEDLNKYISNKKDLYDLLEGDEFGYYLPSRKCPALTVK